MALEFRQVAPPAAEPADCHRRTLDFRRLRTYRGRGGRQVTLALDSSRELRYTPKTMSMRRDQSLRLLTLELLLIGAGEV